MENLKNTKIFANIFPLTEDSEEDTPPAHGSDPEFSGDDEYDEDAEEFDLEEEEEEGDVQMNSD